jgi:hypothetical protein
MRNRTSKLGVFLILVLYTIAGGDSRGQPEVEPGDSAHPPVKRGWHPEPYSGEGEGPPSSCHHPSIEPQETCPVDAPLEREIPPGTIVGGELENTFTLVDIQRSCDLINAEVQLPSLCPTTPRLAVISAIPNDSDPGNRGVTFPPVGYTDPGHSREPAIVTAEDWMSPPPRLQEGG